MCASVCFSQHGFVMSSIPIGNMYPVSALRSECTVYLGEKEFGCNFDSCCSDK